jgi:hypothetical protein
MGGRALEHRRINLSSQESMNAINSNGNMFSQRIGHHYDLHAFPDDTAIGSRCSAKDLRDAIRLFGPDFVQTDCKGHQGLVSWFSKTPEANVPPGLKKDVLKLWREATRQLGLPLHGHYSGIWDNAAGAKHPEWRVIVPPGMEEQPAFQNSGAPVAGTMCPRSDYLEKLMIPQMIEAIDRYGLDGFWIDGDIWAVKPCYCPKCVEAFSKQTGNPTPPTEVSDPLWPRWWTFTRESYGEFVSRYCDAIHQHKPGIKICSNWLHTFRDPGEPKEPTDWISGDNVSAWGIDPCRCEARFISTRGKPWDIMIWGNYWHIYGDPVGSRNVKPPQMLMQEAAIVLSLGGSVQLYTPHCGLRDGRLIPWMMRRMGAVVKFARKRKALCEKTESVPQVVILHSEHHLRNTARSASLYWNTDIDPVIGATCAILQNHFAVDVMDEWALLPRLHEFPLVVAPERHAISETMRDRLKSYVEAGGCLLVTGADSFATFGAKFLGSKIVREEQNKGYYLPSRDGTVGAYSATWQLLKPTTASPLGLLRKTILLDQDVLTYPSATLHKVGQGRVAYIPFDVFRTLHHEGSPMLTAFVGDVLRRLKAPLALRVKAPACVDVVFRRRGTSLRIHFINRSSGIPNKPNAAEVDEIPNVGPVEMTLSMKHPPTSVTRAFEKSGCSWSFAKGKLRAILPSVHIHEILVIETAAQKPPMKRLPK